MKITIAFLLSAIIHIMLLYSMMTPPISEPPQKSPPSRMSIKVIDKLNDAVVKTKDLSDSKGKIAAIPKKKQKKKIECKKYYTGIGIQTMPGSCFITRVFKGYSADRAGLQDEDLIISPDCSQIRGPEGSKIRMKIMRGSKVLNLVIEREKICGQDESP